MKPFIYGIGLCFTSFLLYCLGDSKVYVIIFVIGLLCIALAEVIIGIKLGAKLRCRNK